MKKRMRKGSLLIALSLLLAMMMGMSVHAREAQMYDLGIEDCRKNIARLKKYINKGLLILVFF